MRIEDLLDRATAASQGGRREEARELLVDVLALDPGNLEAWLRLAELAATPERAAIYYRRASAVDPRSLRAQKGLAETQAIPQPIVDQNKPAHVPAYPKEERAAPFRPVPVNPLAFPPDAPIFVDNEVAPFTLELDKPLGSKNISFTQSNRSVGDRIEKGPDDQPPVEAISS